MNDLLGYYFSGQALTSKFHLVYFSCDLFKLFIIQSWNCYFKSDKLICQLDVWNLTLYNFYTWNIRYKVWKILQFIEVMLIVGYERNMSKVTDNNANINNYLYLSQKQLPRKMKLRFVIIDCVGYIFWQLLLRLL